MKQRGSFATARAFPGVILALGLCALLAGPALAAGASHTTVAAPPVARRHAARAHRASRPTTIARPRMRAILDPATGRLVPALHPTDAPGTEAAAPLNTPTAAGALTSGATPRVTTLVDGTQLVDVPPDQQEYEVVRVGKDGKLLRACVHGDPKAATFHAHEER